MPFNLLPEFLHENGEYTRVDLDFEGELSSDPDWLSKVKLRVGSVVVEFNALEKDIEDSILDLMNERGEDSRIWVFLENMPASRKIHALFQIYDRIFEHAKVSARTIGAAKDLKTRILELNSKRNLYVHANWMNTIDEMVEHRTRRLKSGNYVRVRQRITMSEIDSDINVISNLANEVSEFYYETSQELTYGSGG